MTVETTRRSAPGDPFAVLGHVGAAFVIALGALIALVQLLGALGARPLSPGAPGAVTTVGFLGAGVVAFLRMRKLRRRSGRARGWVALAAAPAGLLGVYALAARGLPVGERTEWFMGGDHVRHVIMAAGDQSAGWLTYATTSYPRGWHALLASTWSAFGIRPRVDIIAVTDLSAAMVWGLSVILTLTTAGLASSWTRHRGSSVRLSALAGLLAGSVTLLPSFLGNYQGLGLEGSILGAVVLAVLLRSQLCEPGARALMLSAAAVVVLAHTWQLLLPVAGLAALRSGFAVAGRSRRACAAVAALAVVTLAASAPSLWAVVTDIGISHATDAGVVVPVPWFWLAGGLLGMSVLSLRASGTERWVLLLVVVPALMGVALAAYVGITVDTYYASKMLWHTAALGLAPMSVVTVIAFRRLEDIDAHAGVVGRSVWRGALVLLVLFAGAQPASAYLGLWSTTNGPATLRLLTTPDAEAAQVVWSGEGVGTDTITRVLLDAVRPDPGPLRTPQRILSIEEECRLLRAASAPTVLTDRPPQEVSSRYACTPDVRVIETR